MIKYTNARLVNDIKRGDENAFDYIYLEYSRLVFHVALSIVGNYELTKDLVQETFTRFYASRELLDPKKNVKYYLLAIAKNLALETVKSRREQEELNEEEVEDGESGIQRYESFDEMIDKFRKVLTDDEIDIVVLHLSDDMKFKDIAMVKNATLSSITSKYDRAIKKIKKCNEREKIYE